MRRSATDDPSPRRHDSSRRRDESSARPGALPPCGHHHRRRRAMPTSTRVSILITLAGFACAARATEPARSPQPAEAAVTALAAPAVAEPAVAEASIAPPGPGDWARWSHDKKRAYMKATFMGAERAVFATFEPVRYQRLGCVTCHGAGAR